MDLVSNGKTERAYASSTRYFIDDTVIMANFPARRMGGPDSSLSGTSHRCQSRAWQVPHGKAGEAGHWWMLLPTMASESQRDGARIPGSPAVYRGQRDGLVCRGSSTAAWEKSCSIPADKGRGGPRDEGALLGLTVENTTGASRRQVDRARHLSRARHLRASLSRP